MCLLMANEDAETGAPPSTFPPSPPGSTRMSRPPAKPRGPDGRHLRSRRTRLAIIEAFLQLLTESPKIPTAVLIAKRAGCSVRSVFERFTDLLTLSLAAADHVVAQGLAQAVPRDVTEGRATRIRSQVETRSDICERWLPLWRVLNRHQDESEELPRRIALMRNAVIARLELMYAPELGTMSEPDRKRLLIVLEALTDFESWGRMRERHGLSIEEAREVWIHTIDRLLPPTPGTG